MVPWASLQFVIEAIPDHTHVLFYIYKLIKYSDRLVLMEELFKETQPWRTLDIIQKYDRPLLDLFKFTGLLLGIHIHLIQNAQLSSGVENGFV